MGMGYLEWPAEELFGDDSPSRPTIAVSLEASLKLHTSIKAYCARHVQAKGLSPSSSVS